MRSLLLTSLFSFFLMIAADYALAQPKSASVLAGQLEEYYAQRAEEKVYLHIASHYAQAGDQLPFQAYVLDAFSNEPTQISKVLRVELWDKELSRRLTAQRLKIEDGVAQGAIKIPASVSNGQYVVRAFTQWMVNYDMVTDVPLIVDKAGDFAVQPVNNGSLVFVPEGGKLVAGLANKIVVMSDGPTNGTVMNAKGKEVAAFDTNTDGLGAFVLVPGRGEQYTIDTGDENLKYDFPLVEDVGLACLLQQTKSGFRINLQASKGLTRELDDGAISVIVESRGIAYFTITGDIKKNGYFVADLDASTLPHSPGRILAFDSYGQLLSERAFFNIPDDTAPVHTNLSRSVFDRRERVDLSIFNDVEESMKLSVSVSKADHYVANTTTIDEFGAINSFSPSGIESDSENLDWRMIAGAWKSADWYEVEQTSDYAYRPERLLAYSGIAYDTEGNPVKDKTLDVWLVNHDEVYQAQTNANGEFNLVLFDFSGSDDFLFDSKEVALGSVEISQTSESLPNETQKVAAVSERDYSYKRRINQVYDFYQTDGDGQNNRPKLDLITKADYTVDLDKYIEFETMKEMFVEVVVGVLVGNDNTLRVYMDKEGRYSDKAPLYFINGQPTYDDQFVLDLDPLDIDQISVLNTEETLLKYKSVAQSGIIDIRLKEDISVESPKTYVKNMNGLSTYQATQYPNYDDQLTHSRLPDLREQLYWRGGVEIEASKVQDLTFYTSDIVGDYSIIIEGITNSGRTFRLVEQIEVGTMLE